MLVDVFSKGLTGKVAEAALGKAGITVNKNAIPFDQNPPMVASGIRIGTPAVTTRGMGEREMDRVGELILRALAATDNDTELARVKGVESLCQQFPRIEPAGLKPRPTSRLKPRPTVPGGALPYCRRLKPALPRSADLKVCATV